ncbi:MAG: DNA-protecting protein DprA [Candidatus Levybacteria bacterium]|nr:DNA-protecting protein DprA [Candidatus Levybacteria bacterium]
MNDRTHWLGFSVFPGIGPRKFDQLLSEFGFAKAAWKAKQTDLASVLGLKLSQEFIRFRNTFSFSDYEKKLTLAKVSFIILTDSSYPSLLKQADKPPFVLYIKGPLSHGALVANDPSKPDVSSPRQELSPAASSAPTIAIVGTRKITQYGREVTELFTRELVDAGFTIVSGLAMGVDAVAHQTTIDNKGTTIAVLGCGVDCCLPLENEHIYNSILDSGGCIVSELPLGHPPTIGSFPARNRIIAGMSQAVLVTEGAEDSGALITADCAFKYNRKVFAVPGPITSQLSKGPYKLIAKGARLVTSGQDIIKELGIRNKELGKVRKNIRGETKEETVILDLLANESLHFDEIVRRCGFTSSKTGVLLSLLEMKGQIKNINATYSLKAAQ